MRLPKPFALFRSLTAYWIDDFRAAEAMYGLAAKFCSTHSVVLQYEEAGKRIVQISYTDGTPYDHGSWLLSSTTPKRQFDKLIRQSVTFGRDSAIMRTAHVHELVLGAWKVRKPYQFLIHLSVYTFPPGYREKGPCRSPVIIPASGLCRPSPSCRLYPTAGSRKRICLSREL